MNLDAGERLENWQIEGLLGQGGMGSVYRARSLVLTGVEAAVKVTRPRDFAHARERFGREVKALLKLHHPAVVRVLGFGQDEDRELLWFAMELVQGHPLDLWLDSGAIPTKTALRLFAHLCDGLAHAHSRGVAHRDLKPANVIVDEQGVGTLVDFGISATEGDHRLTRTGQIVGTPQYLPPEALEGRLRDPLVADVYAMGQMLVESLKGDSCFPFDPTLTSTQNALRVMHLKSMGGSLDPGGAFPEGLRALCRRATAPDPTDRVPSAADFRDELLALAADGTVTPSWGTPIQGRQSPPTLAPHAPTTASETMALEPPPTPSAGPSTAPDVQADAEPRRRRSPWLALGGVVAVLLLLLSVGTVLAVAGVLSWMAMSDEPAAPVVAGLAEPAAPPAGTTDVAPPPASPAPSASVSEPPPAEPRSSVTPQLPGTPVREPSAAPEADPQPTAAPPDNDGLTDEEPIDAAPDVEPVEEPPVEEPPASTGPDTGGITPFRPDWNTVLGIRAGMSDRKIEDLLGPGRATGSPYCKTAESARSYLDDSVVVCRLPVVGARRIHVTRSVLNHRSELPFDAKTRIFPLTPEQLENVIGAPQSRRDNKFLYRNATVTVDFSGGTTRSLLVEW